MNISWPAQLGEFLKILRDSGISYLPKAEIKPADNLVDEVYACKACHLADTVTNKVFGQGPVPCPVMLIGEGPGADEDRTGIPFVGKAGQLLDKILGAVDISRDDVYMGNVIKCRPPNNRNPLPDEIALCMPYLKRQIDMVDPKFVVAMGAVAARSLLGIQGALNRMREQFYLINGRYYMVTYHPAALLRNERYKKPAWEDWKMFRAAFNKYKADGTLPQAVEINELV